MELKPGKWYTPNLIRSLFREMDPVEKKTLLGKILDFFFSERENITLHTSGSTGKPKPLQLNRDAIYSSALATGKGLKFQKGQTYLVCLPLDRIGGFMALMRALIHDMNIVWIPPSTSPISDLKYLGFDGVIHFASSVPAQMEDFIQNLNQLNGIQQILVGGAPIPSSLEEKATQSGLPFLTTFGMTETLSHIAWRPLGQTVKRFIALPGVKVRADKDGNLEIKGPVTRDQWIKTTDQVEILNDHSFIWLGRNDFVINTGGYKVQPEQLEQTIRELLDVLKIDRDLMISSQDDQQWGELVVLVYEGDAMEQKTLEKMDYLLKGALPKHMVPRKVISLKNFPKTEGGKLDRNQIRKMIRAS